MQCNAWKFQVGLITFYDDVRTVTLSNQLCKGFLFKMSEQCLWYLTFRVEECRLIVGQVKHLLNIIINDMRACPYLMN